MVNRLQVPVITERQIVGRLVRPAATPATERVKVPSMLLDNVDEGGIRAECLTVERDPVVVPIRHAHLRPQIGLKLLKRASAHRPDAASRLTGHRRNPPPRERAHRNRIEFVAQMSATPLIVPIRCREDHQSPSGGAVLRFPKPRRMRLELIRRGHPTQR